MGQRLGFGLFLFIPVIALTGCSGGFGGSIKSEVKTAADFIAQKQDEKAKSALDPVLASDPKDSRANYYSAVVDEHARKYKDALEKLNVAIDVDPGYAEAYSERALVQTRLGDNDAALADANRATQLAPDVPLNHLRRALVAINSKEWQLALDSLDTVAKLDGKKQAYWIAAYRAEAYLGMKDLKRALDYFDEAARVGGKEQPVVFLRRAMCRAKLSDFGGAKKDCTQFLAARPDDPSAHALMGALLCLNGDAAGARKQYAHCIGKASAADLADTVDLGADDNLAVTELVDIYLEKKDAETAAAILTRVESHRPLEPTEQYRLALANFALERPERALSLLNSCISMAPEYVAPRVELIHYYASTGLTSKAMELQREAYAVAHSAKDKSDIAGAMVRRKGR
jgi:tetratricopeptide (TPR) repeat protein